MKLAWSRNTLFLIGIGISIICLITTGAFFVLASTAKDQPNSTVESKVAGVSRKLYRSQKLNSLDKNVAVTRPTSQNTIDLPVLMYHHLNTLQDIPSNDAIGVSLRVSPSVFDRQLNYIKEKGYNTVTSQDIVNYIDNKGQLPPKPLLMIFDDGYKDNHTYALPILKKYNMKAEFSIITGQVGKNDYMSWDDIIDSYKQGMSINSHTVNHCYLAVDNPDKAARSTTPFLESPADNRPNQLCPQFTWGGQLNTGQLTGELEVSKKTLEDKLGTSIVTITYPYGKYNSQTEEIAKKLGYRLGFSTQAQVNEKFELDNLFGLRRYRVFGQQDGPLTGFFEGKR